ncbi:MAG: indole-3-glycerol phosphate synthase TrpC [Planctomycetaceae bacterium]|nr:MAG: indole-3-glycerol phosphate synthase TrpC [Planctomycetaceae bacterium]
MVTLLEKIVARKQREIATARERVSEAELESIIEQSPPPIDFFGALSAPGPIRLIAEFKRKSPSAGSIRPGAVVEDIARAYASAGASALSILTDADDFGGSLDDLSAAKRSVALPILRKEFIVDRYQVLEARAAGADAVLLIAECLDDCRLRSLYREILTLGMTPLVELHSQDHLSRVLDIGATLIGINNRDLHTMTTRLEHVLELCDKVPRACVIVAESGIRSREDVERLQNAGISAMLVGESLLRSADPGKAAAMLLGYDGSGS